MLLKGIYIYREGYLYVYGLGFRVQVPKNQVLGVGVIGSIVQVLGRYMIIEYFGGGRLWFGVVRNLQEPRVNCRVLISAGGGGGKP